MVGEFDGGIDLGIPRIMVVAYPGDDSVSSGEAWVLGGYLVRSGRDWGRLDLVLLSFLLPSGVIGLGVRRIIFVAAPKADTLAGDGV